MGVSFIVLGAVKLELRFIESCSSSSNFSSSYNLNSDDLSTVKERCFSTKHFAVKFSYTVGYEFSLPNLTLSRF